MDLLPLRRRPLAPDESAVSEIVGSSLILSITVVLFSVIIVWVSTLEGPDEKRFVDLDGSLAVTGAGGTIPIIHSGGENLYENLTFIQLFLNDTPSKLNLSVGGVGTTWEMGETWTYNSATIGTNTKVEIRVIEQSSELNQILLSIVLQSGNLAGVNDPAIHMAWSSPDTVTADGATTFCILAYATDVDGNLNTSKAGSVNLAAVGGAAAVTLSDPDGDGTYTTSDQTLAKNVDPGQYKLTLTFTDATGRTDTTKVVLKVRALDLVYTRSDTVIALLEPPSWSSSSTVQATDGGSAYTALAVGDSDNDNDNDTAAGTAGGAVHHWANDGSWTRTVVATPGSQINELIMLDIDGDSKDDILVGTAGGSVILYDAGTAWAATTLDATLGAVHALAVADMDGDTDLDVVVGTGRGARGSRYRPPEGVIGGWKQPQPQVGLPLESTATVVLELGAQGQSHPSGQQGDVVLDESAEQMSAALGREQGKRKGAGEIIGRQTVAQTPDQLLIPARFKAVLEIDVGVLDHSLDDGVFAIQAIQVEL